MGQPEPCLKMQLFQLTRWHHLAVVQSYHGNSGCSSSSADRRSWDNAARWPAHIYCHNKAFTHRLHILRTESQQNRSFMLNNCCWHLLQQLEKVLKITTTYHKALVKGRVHSFKDVAVCFPFQFTLIAMAFFVVFCSQKYTERVDLCLVILGDI